MTYNYLANHENSTIAGWVEKYGFVWNEDKYNYACIRTAEMAWQYNEYLEAFHERLNGLSLNCEGENLAYKAVFDASDCNILVKYDSTIVLQDWLDSVGRRLTIEGGYENMSSAKFTFWVSEWDSWGIIWVQHFYYN